jgi:DNA-binding CsgD family transcriptional regulator
MGVLIEGLGPFADETRTAEQVACDVLGQQTYADAEERGSRLSPERFEVQRIALGTLSINTLSIDTLSPDALAAKGTSNWETLSEAEQEVAILAAAGWSNSAIGMRRGTSIKTTEGQMASIFQKLMIDSRQDVVRFVPQDQRNRLTKERLHRPRRNQGKPRSNHSRPQD